MRTKHKRQRSYLQRFIPHPLLTLVLIGLWVALLNSISAGVLAVGMFLGLVIPIYTAHFWPDRPVIRKPWLILSFVIILMIDVIVANIHVAYLIVFRRSEELRSHWITIPLDLTTAEAITALAGTITLTPGTISSDLSADGRSLLVHCLDLENEEATVVRIKQRYERRIKAILS